MIPEFDQEGTPDNSPECPEVSHKSCPHNHSRVHSESPQSLLHSSLLGNLQILRRHSPGEPRVQFTVTPEANPECTPDYSLESLPWSTHSPPRSESRVHVRGQSRLLPESPEDSCLSPLHTHSGVHSESFQSLPQSSLQGALQILLLSHSRGKPKSLQSSFKS